MKDKYWIAFSSLEQIDSSFTLKLFKYFSDIEKAFNVSSNDLKNVEGLSVKKAENFLRLRDKVDPDKVLSEDIRLCLKIFIIRRQFSIIKVI